MIPDYSNPFFWVFYCGTTAQYKSLTAPRKCSSILGVSLYVFELVDHSRIKSNRTGHKYMSRLFNYYDAKDTVTWGEAIFFAFGVVFCSSCNVMVQHPFMMAVMHMGMKIRVGVCSLIYRKVIFIIGIYILY